MANSTALGTEKEIQLPTARIRYRESGEGPPVVFVHGVLVNADLWRKVVPAIAAAGYRCIAPDWPFGAHSVPVPNADLSPTGAADLIATFLVAMDLQDVTLVANDTGGAITQILMSRHPERIGRVVLTPADSYEKFFPPILAPLALVAKIPGSIRPLTQIMRIKATHRLPFVFGWVSKRPLPPELVESSLRPSRENPGIRKDFRRFLRGINKSYTLEAAKSFPTFTQPVLLAWANEDKFFPVELAHRLAKDLPNATLRTIDDSYTFVPEDQPELLIDMILEFTRVHATS